MSELHEFFSGDGEVPIFVKTGENVLHVMPLGECSSGNPGQILDDLDKRKPSESAISIDVFLEQFGEELLCANLCYVAIRYASIFFLRLHTHFRILRMDRQFNVCSIQSLCMYSLISNQTNNPSSYLNHPNTYTRGSIPKSIHKPQNYIRSLNQSPRRQQLPPRNQNADINVADEQNPDLTLKDLMKRQISAILTQEEKKYQDVNRKQLIKSSETPTQQPVGFMNSTQKKILNPFQKNAKINKNTEKTDQTPVNLQLIQKKARQGAFPSSLQESPSKFHSIQKNTKGIVNSREKKSKKIKTEQLISNSSAVRKYELNMDKFKKIEDDREQIFKARPKLNSTPGLVVEKPRSIPRNRKKIGKSKTQSNANPKLENNEEILERKYELPNISKKSHIEYTESPRCFNILQNVSQSLILSKNNHFEYRPVSLNEENQGEKQLQLSKVLRKRRLNFLKP